MITTRIKIISLNKFKIKLQIKAKLQIKFNIIRKVDNLIKIKKISMIHKLENNYKEKHLQNCPDPDLILAMMKYAGRPERKRL